MFRANNLSKNLPAWFYFFLVIFVFNQCSSLIGTAGNNASDTISSAASGSDDPLEKSDPGEYEMRPASIPAPTSKKKTVAFNPTSDATAPVIGFDEAVSTTGTDSGTGETYTMTDGDGDGYMDDYYVAAGLESLTAGDDASFCENFTPGQLDYSGADSEGHTYTCCSITTAGAFECYLPNATVDSTAHIYVTAGSTLGEETTEAVNASLLWTRSEPLDVKTGPGGLNVSDAGGANLIFGLTEASGIAIKEDGDNFSVLGSADEHYRMFDNMDQRQIVYDRVNVQLSGLTYAAGIVSSSFDLTLAELSGLSEAIDYVGTRTIGGTETYNRIKTATNGVVYFVRKPVEPIDTDHDRKEYLYSPLSDADDVPYYVKGAGKYLSSIDNTIAFDVQSDDAMLVLVESGESLYLLNVMSTRYQSQFVLGDGAPLDVKNAYDENGLSYFRDIQIYQESSGASLMGQALLIDQANDRIGVLSYNFEAAETPGIQGWVKLGDGKSPVALDLNVEKSKAYVLNAGDNTVTILSLKGASGTARKTEDISTATISLSDYFSEKSLSLTPTEISHHVSSSGTEYLVISEKGLKGSLVVNLSTATVAEE